MRNDSAQAVAVFREELLLCGVEPDQTVAILATEDKLEDRVRGFTVAARSLSANCYALTIPPFELEGTLGIGYTSLAGRDDLLGLLKKADLIVDLCFIRFAPELQELLQAGARVISVVEPLPMLRRLLPTRQLRRRVEAAAEQLADATELRVTSTWGTDLTYELSEDFPVVDEYGFTDTPGRWDNWPSGFVTAYARENGVAGTLVVKAGDALLLPVPHFVREPIRLTIEEGYMTDIAGNNLDAVLLRDFFPDPEDRDAYAIAHIGWGLNKDARWSLYPEPGILQMELRGFCGNVMFSTGPNISVGGARETPVLLDIPMRDCSLALDGELVVEAGRLLTPAQV